MSGIIGWIQGFSDAQAYAPIIRRNADIDTMLTKAGIDPATINCVHSPLVGASDFARARVLVSTKAGSDLYSIWNRPQDSTDPWELHLVEPTGSATYSENNNPAQPVSPTTPEIVVVNNVGITPQNRSGIDQPAEGFAVMPMQSDAGADPSIAMIAQRSDKQSNRAADTGEAVLATAIPASITTQPTGVLQGLQGSPRSMSWVGLVATSIIELRRDAAGTTSINPSGRPRRNDNALFVIDFVDARYRLQGFRSMYYKGGLGENDSNSNGSIRGGDNQEYTGGMTRSRFNMLAEMPVAFEANTVKKSITYPPAQMDFPGFASEAADSERAPSWNRPMKTQRTARHWTNTASAATHFQQPYSRDELLSMFARQVQLAAGQSNLTLDLTFYQSQLASPSGEAVFDDGDMFNLDFSGMTLGEAMDMFAQRIGCVWLYDRACPSLVLSLARKSILPTDTNVPQSVPDLGTWMTDMEAYRAAGYINTLTLDIPQTVVVTHATQYCSRCGPERSGSWDISWRGVMAYDAEVYVHTFAHLVDCRSQTTNDGVISTRFVTGLNADAPGLWHALSPAITHTVVEIRDHVPALVGHNTPVGYVPVWLPGTNWYTASGGTWTFGPEYWFAVGKPKGIGTTNLKLDTTIAPDADAADFEVPWNYTSPTLRTSYRDLNLNELTDVPLEQSDLFDPTGHQLFDTSLKQRREILQTRITELRRIADGDATFERMPPNTMYDVQRQITPSVGLQYESVHFGAPDITTVKYRIWGKNTHPLLYPYGAKFETATSGFGVSATLTSGQKNFAVRRPHKQNVLRVFMARVIGKYETPIIPEDETNLDFDPFTITKYVFVEATPDSNPFTMYWSSADALGNKGLTSGIAFNLYEQWFNPTAYLGTSTTDNPPYSVGGMPIVQDFGPNDNYKKQIPYVPAPFIVPVYEVANRLGFSSYWIAIQPDMRIECPPNPPSGMAMPTPPAWPYMGASGAALSTSGDLASIIENA